MLSSSWVREYVAAVSEMLRLMDETRETLSNRSFARFHLAESLVRRATAEGAAQVKRGTLVMYDPESGTAWRHRAEEYAAQVQVMRELQRGFVVPTGHAAADALAAQELIVDSLTTALLLPEVPAPTDDTKGGAK